MKKNILVLLCFLLVGHLSLQADEFTFLGTPIGGSLGNFSYEMRYKGYKVIDQNDSECWFKGPLYGFDDVIFKASVGTTTKKVDNVEVFLPIHESWEALVYYYNYMKQYLFNSYGKALLSTENFKKNGSDYIPTSDEERLLLVRHNKCEYKTTCWVTPTGSVTVSIQYWEELKSYFISVSYVNMADLEYDLYKTMEGLYNNY